MHFRLLSERVGQPGSLRGVSSLVGTVALGLWVSCVAVLSCAFAADGSDLRGGRPVAQVAEEPTPSLDALVARLEARFGGQRPAAWGERLPGVLTRLPATTSPGNPKRSRNDSLPRLSGVTAARGDISGQQGEVPLQDAAPRHQDAAPRHQVATPGQPTGTAGPEVMALTLDACGGGYDAGIIDMLRQLRIPATLFVTGRWIREHPDAFADLASDPLFEMADHGERHRPASVTGRRAYGIRGTASVRELVLEVELPARAILAATGRRPAFFRPGTAFCDDVAVQVVGALGMTVAGYTVAADAGATLPAPAVRRNVETAPSGAILLCHMNHPASGTREGLAQALPALLQRGVRFVTLSGGVAAGL